MLDEQERRSLAAIEQALARQDPAFAARMGDPPAPEEHRFPTILVLCALFYVTAPMMALLFGWVAAVVTFDVFAVLVAAELVRRDFVRTSR